MGDVIEIDRVDVEPLKPGAAGVRQTLDLMRRFSLAGTVDPIVVRVMRCAPADPAGILRWVRAKVPYQRDSVTARMLGLPRSAEVVSDPRRTLMVIGAGDCDDQAVVLATLAQLAGIPVRFVALKTGGEKDRSGGWLHDHVFPELLVDGEWIAAETTIDVPLGWRAHGKDEIAVDVEGRVDPAGMAGFFDDVWDWVGDAADDVVQFVADVSTWPIKQIWEHAPKELREIAMALGPQACDVFFPGTGVACREAVRLLEENRLSKRQKKKLKKLLREAVEQGSLPAWFDPSNKDHVEAFKLAQHVTPEMWEAYWEERGVALDEVVAAEVAVERPALQRFAPLAVAGGAVVAGVALSYLLRQPGPRVVAR